MSWWTPGPSEITAGCGYILIKEGSKTLLIHLLRRYSLKNDQSVKYMQDYAVKLYFLLLTTMTCVTVFRLASPAIKVLRSTPLVQNVSSVFGETLRFQSQQLLETFPSKHYKHGLVKI